MTTTALIGREDLLPYVNVGEDDDHWDTLLQALVLAATEMIEDYCGTTFTLGEATEYFESYETSPGDPEPQFLWLAKAPISEDVVVKVFYDASRVWATQLPAAQVFVEMERGLVRVYSNTGVNQASLLGGASGAAFLSAQPGFKVTYEGGYEVKTDSPWGFLKVPPTLMAACGLQTNYMFRASTQDASGIVTMVADTGNPQKKLPLGNKDYQLVDEAKALLKRYVRRNLVGRLL